MPSGYIRALLKYDILLTLLIYGLYIKLCDIKIN